MHEPSGAMQWCLCKGSQSSHDRSTGESLEVSRWQTDLSDTSEKKLAPLPLVARYISSAQTQKIPKVLLGYGLQVCAQQLKQLKTYDEVPRKAELGPGFDRTGGLWEVLHPQHAGGQVTHRLRKTVTPAGAELSYENIGEAAKETALHWCSSTRGSNQIKITDN